MEYVKLLYIYRGTFRRGECAVEDMKLLHV